MKLSHIVAALGGELQGNDIDVDRLASMEEAGPAQLTFLANPKYRSQLDSTAAGAVIVKPALAEAAAKGWPQPDPDAGPVPVLCPRSHLADAAAGRAGRYPSTRRGGRGQRAGRGL